MCMCLCQNVHVSADALGSHSWIRNAPCSVRDLKRCCSCCHSPASAFQALRSWLCATTPRLYLCLERYTFSPTHPQLN